MFPQFAVVIIRIYTLYNIRIDLKTNFISIATTARYLGKRPKKSQRDFPMLIQPFNICSALKARRTRPGKAVCPTVSSCMRRSFRGISPPKAERKILLIFLYFWPQGAFFSPCERIEIKKPLSQSLQSPLVFYPYF